MANGLSRDGLCTRSGSASLLVLGILAVCASLIAVSQVSLSSSSTRLRIRKNRISLRTASLLGLRQGMELLADDTIPAYDDAREDWGQPLRFITSEGVSVSVIISDAQNRLNINHFNQPLSPGTVRTPEDMFSDLATLKGTEIDAEELNFLAATMREEELELQDPMQLLSIQPGLMESFPFMAMELSALPSTQTRPIQVNLNSVRPVVLSALVGPQLQAWVEQVLLAREAAPLPSVAAVSRSLPSVIQPLLSRAVDVRSTYFEIQVTSLVDSMEETLRVLVQRTSDNGVEVLRCQW